MIAPRLVPSSRSRRTLFAAVVFAMFGTTSAAAAPELSRLFPKAASVEVATTGPGTLLRLQLPTEVLAACRADLSDLRVVDARGTETAFVIDRGPGVTAPTRLRVVSPTVLSAVQHETPRVGAQPMVEETYELSAPPAAPKDATWQLTLEVRTDRFVRGLLIESLSADAQQVEASARDTVFKLRDGTADRLRVPIPGAAGRRLRVTLTGENSGPLEPRFQFEAVERVAAEPVALVELALAEAAASAGQRSSLEFLRAAGIVPSALRVETTTSAFSRGVEVRDLGGSSHGELLGKGSVFRVPGAALIEQLEIQISPAQGARIGIGIDNGDSPPLEALKVHALIRTPSLVFSLRPEAGHDPIATLYFGGGRAHAPRYDLTALVSGRSEQPVDDRDRAARSLFGSTPLSIARLGAIRENAEFDKTPALAFAQRAGNPVDVSSYSHRRAVALTPSGDGLSEIVLSAQDLSVVQPDLRDVRVVDDAAKQWPFLLQPGTQTESVTLTRQSEKPARDASRTSFSATFTPLVANALVIDTPEPYFDRAFRLEAELLDGSRRELAQGRLSRTADSRTALVVDFPPTPVRRFELSVEDGDNAALALSAARARVPVPSLYVAAKPGSYQVLLGNPNAQPAHYDIERARSLVLSVTSDRSSLRALEPNPAYRAATRLAEGGGPERIALWLVLGAAVLFLGALTFRLVKREEQQSPKA